MDVVSAKDLRDTPASVFADHLNNTPAVQSEWFNEYIMNPRVANEFLTPYKSFFAANIEPSLAKQAVENPQALVDWVKNNVSINDALNAQRIPIMPMGVWIYLGYPGTYRAGSPQDPVLQGQRLGRRRFRGCRTDDR